MTSTLAYKKAAPFFIFFLILNSLFFVETLKLPTWTTQPESGFIPLVVTVATYLLLASSFVRDLKGGRLKVNYMLQSMKLSLSLIREQSRAALFLLVTFLYVLALQVLGYYISSMLFCAGLSMLFVVGKSKLETSLVMAVASSALSLAVNYLLFVRVFNVPLG